MKLMLSHRQAFDMQNLDQELPKQWREVAYLTADLQQTMPLTKHSLSKVFNLSQLWFYNLRVHLVNEWQDDISHFFTWTEDVACLGSNKMASFLLAFIQFEDSLRSKDNFIIYLVFCSGQNGNSSILFFY